MKEEFNYVLGGKNIDQAPKKIKEEEETEEY